MIKHNSWALLTIVDNILTLGVDGVEGGHFVVISIAADLPVPDSSNAFRRSVSDIASALSTLMLCWCYVTYDVVDNGVNDARYSEASNLTLSPKLLRQIPSIFWRGYHRDDLPKRWKFRENLAISFWEIFWNRNYSFLGPLLQGVRMLRFYFWVLEKFRAPRTYRFGDMRGESFNFPTPSPKIGWSNPLHILHRVY